MEKEKQEANPEEAIAGGAPTSVGDEQPPVVGAEREGEKEDKDTAKLAAAPGVEQSQEGSRSLQPAQRRRGTKGVKHRERGKLRRLGLYQVQWRPRPNPKRCPPSNEGDCNESWRVEETSSRVPVEDMGIGATVALQRTTQPRATRQGL